MNIHSIETGFFSTDGGAMFGIVSRKVWSGKYPVDDENRCPLTMRVLFADMGDHKVLFDTGVGTARVHGMEYYRFHDIKDIRKELEKIGYKASDVTDVVFSHLHFDHCGGAAFVGSNGAFEPTFPNAVHWAGRKQYDLTFKPSLWEADSFAPPVVKVLHDSGLLRLVDSDKKLFRGVDVKLFHGHTEDQLVSYVSTPHGVIAVCGDVVPMTTHVMPLCIAAVDNSAEIAVNEKMRFLEDAVENDYVLFFFHDAVTQAVRLKKNKDRISVKEKVSAIHLFPTQSPLL
jgi:glyoxylase-like metal-dependent hydrolase (beta-lactamase superfamily II)